MIQHTPTGFTQNVFSATHRPRHCLPHIDFTWADCLCRIMAVQAYFTSFCFVFLNESVCKSSEAANQLLCYLQSHFALLASWSGHSFHVLWQHQAASVEDHSSSDQMNSNSSVDYFSLDCLSGSPGIFQWVLFLFPDCGMNLCSWQERSLYQLQRPGQPTNMETQDGQQQWGHSIWNQPVFTTFPAWTSRIWDFSDPGVKNEKYAHKKIQSGCF